MNTWEAIAYGAVQGITEYLPVSSSAHLILFPKFMHWEDPGLAFDVFLHLGTLLATLIYFRRDWFLFLLGKAEVKPIHIVLGTAPALLVGFLIHHWVETVFRGDHIIAIALFIGGLMLWISDRRGSKQKEVSQITARDALVIGCVQCLALIPGFSRSGSTILAGLLLGLTRPAAARFSFLLSAPITAAALVYELKKLISGGFGADLGWTQLGWATVSSFLFGMLAISALLRWIRRVSYGVFAIYRTALAFILFL